MSRALIGNDYSLTKLVILSSAVFLACSAHAQTEVSSASTTPLATSSAGDVTIDSGDSITVSGTNAVTIDSNNSLTNSGAITVNDGNQTNGVLVTGGTSGTLAITNNGTITVTDSTLATAIPLTAGENRYGIQINSAAPFSGSITNASAASIIVRGNDSAGIYLNTGGLNGDILNQGAIGLTGDNSFGILTNLNAPINGYISVTNNITSLGVGAGAIQLNGTMSGQLYLDAIVRATAFFSDGVVVTTRPTTLTGLSPNYNLIAGPTVSVLNNIAGSGFTTGGIFVDTAGDIQQLGSAPAIQIAPSNGSSLEIGTSGTYGVTIVGIVESSGIFDGISSTGLQVGGTSGTAKIDGGINISGKVSSIAFGQANATAISLQSGASVPAIMNTGTIVSVVNLGYSGLAVSGTNATAILDDGGALSSITNKGIISATNANGGGAIAMDLSGDTTAVTVTQMASGTTTASSITGDIKFGTAGATLNLASGNLIGGVEFGSATNNFLNITNGSILSGPLTEDAGGTVAVNVSNGRLASTSLTNVSVSSLSVGSAGELDFATNSATGQSGSYTITGTGVGAYIISSGAKIGLDVSAKLAGPETFTVIQTAGSGAILASQPTFQVGDIPYFYTANVLTDPNAGTVSLQLASRSFAQAGVEGSASAYNAVFNSSYTDTGIRDAFNAAGTQQAFKRVYQQMLPTYSGGLFESLAQGSNAVVEAQSTNPIAQAGNHGGAWAQQIGFGEEDSTRSAPGYHGGGIGFAFGWEAPASPISTWGISVSYLRSAVKDFDTGPNNQEVGTVYSAGLYWRETDGAFHTEASLNAGIAEMNSQRNFSSTDLVGNAVTRIADAAWNGGLAQAHLGVSYEEPIGDDYFIRPLLSGDYVVLYDASHAEHNGGTGFDLNVGSEGGKQGSVVGGVAFGTAFADGTFTWKPEVMVGYKQVFGGPDDVSASFAGGSSFTLSPASQQGGPVAHVGVHGGNKFSDFAFEAGGEDRGEYRNFDGRLVARFRF